jgi:hypothetical protein
MRIDRRVVAAVATALTIVQAASSVVLAATGTPPPGSEPVAQQLDVGAIGIAIAILAIALVAVVAAWRRGWGRLIAAIVILAVSGILALTVVTVGVFSDWSDADSNIPLPYLVGAIAMLALGIAIAGRILLDGVRKRTAESGDPAVLR